MAGISNYERQYIRTLNLVCNSGHNDKNIDNNNILRRLPSITIRIDMRNQIPILKTQYIDYYTEYCNNKEIIDNTIRIFNENNNRIDINNDSLIINTIGDRINGLVIIESIDIIYELQYEVILYYQLLKDIALKENKKLGIITFALGEAHLQVSKLNRANIQISYFNILDALENNNQEKAIALTNRLIEQCENYLNIEVTDTNNEIIEHAIKVLESSPKICNNNNEYYIDNYVCCNIDYSIFDAIKGI